MTRSFRIAAVLVVLATLLPAGPAMSSHDTDDVTPPVLEELTFTPSTVDVRDGNAETTVRLQASDDRSDVSYAHVRLTSPDVGHVTQVELFHEAGDLTQWYGDMRVRYGSDDGGWTAVVTLVDSVGNRAVYDADDLEAAGLPLGIDVVSHEDLTAPHLLDAAFDREQVDATAGPAAAKLDVTLEEVGHHNSIIVSLLPSDGTVDHNQGSTSVGPDGGLVTVGFDPNEHVEGEWYVNTMYLRDYVGNRRVLEREDLLAMGVDPRIDVITGTEPDNEGPELVDLSFDTDVVDTTDETPQLTVTYEATDESGLRSGTSIGLEPALSDGSESESVYWWGTDGGFFGFGDHATEGWWSVSRITLRDKAGNQTVLGPDQVHALGLPTEVRVYNGPPPPPGSDIQPPQTTLDGPTGRRTSSYVWAHLGADESAIFECKLDDGPWERCWRPTWHVGPGDHTLRARATDPSGNTDPTPAETSWTVVDDTSPPPGGEPEPTPAPEWDPEPASDGTSSTADPDPFFDDDHSVFEDEIERLAAAGVTRGCNPPVNDRFCPDGLVTRGQLAAFLSRALELPAADEHFVDVGADHVFADPIGALAAADITRGCNPPTNDRFCPAEHVTRGQMAAFLVRAADLPAAAERFVDVPMGHVFADPIGALAAADVTRGCNPPANDRFCPDDLVTRGQMAAFLVRAGVVG